MAPKRLRMPDHNADFHLAAHSPLIHFETCAKIQNAINKRLETPKANVLQRRLAEAYEVLSSIGVPAIRICVTKIRQCGGTTMAVEIIYHICQQRNTDALIIADVAPNAAKILERMETYSTHDRFPWKNPLSPQAGKMQWKNGSCATITSAEAKNPGISQTRQAILFSESAKYPRGGVKDDEKIMASCLPSLNDAGLAIAESTPEGASGWHYQTWQGALSLDDFLAEWQKGNTSPGNGWVKVFAGWFEFSENVKPVTPEMRAKITATLTARESNGIRKYKWTHEQIAWRRAIMASECGGSEDTFDSYYPEDDVSCFLSSGRPRFNQAVLSKWLKATHLHPPETGNLVENNEVYDFHRDPDGFGNFQIWERPQVGCAYIVWCDPATGEDQTESNDPDRHSIGVLRAEYVDAGSRVYHKPAVVARVRPPFTGATQTTADFIIALCSYYGDCIVVLEINMGLHVLERLKDAGVHIYKRQIVDPFDRDTPKFMYGFKLKDKDQRTDITDGLALAIQNEEFDVWCPHIIGEGRTFIVDKNGKATAREGCHDDDVMGLGMAWKCRGSATIYSQKMRRRRRPQDYRQRL